MGSPITEYEEIANAIQLEWEEPGSQSDDIAELADTVAGEIIASGAVAGYLYDVEKEGHRLARELGKPKYWIVITEEGYVPDFCDSTEQMDNITVFAWADDDFDSYDADSLFACISASALHDQSEIEDLLPVLEYRAMLSYYDGIAVYDLCGNAHNSTGFMGFLRGTFGGRGIVKVTDEWGDGKALGAGFGFIDEELAGDRRPSFSDRWEQRQRDREAERMERLRWDHHI